MLRLTTRGTAIAGTVLGAACYLPWVALGYWPIPHGDQMIAPISVAPLFVLGGVAAALTGELPTHSQMLLRTLVFCTTAAAPIPMISWLTFGGIAALKPSYGLYLLVPIALTWGLLLGIVAWLLAALFASRRSAGRLGRFG